MDGRFPWPAFWAPVPPQEWGWPPEDSSGSPSSSPGSGSLSPSESPLCPAAAAAAAAAAPRRSLPEPRVPWSPGPGAPKGGRGGRLGQGQRQSASQREKLRMRHLAKALHTLRRYLPPSVAPAGQSLTKIETLRLAIRYIGHLSELLGLGEEALARRAAPLARRCCHLCPPGLGCCQPERSAQERQAGPGAEVCCWPSPPCGIRPPPTFLDPSSPPGTGGPSRPRPLAASPVTAAPAAASWLSAAAYCPEGGNSAARCEAGGTGAEALLLPAEFADLGLSPQSLPGELVSFLEGLLPPASHE